MRKLIASMLSAGAALATLSLSTTASAQAVGPFGDTGQAIFSVDRLMPLFSYENRKDGGNPTVSTSTSSISLITHGETVTMYNVPRFAFDYVVTSHLTIGGSVYVFFQTGNSTTTTGNNGVQVTNDEAKATLWGIAPRVGYVISLSDKFAFWPRGGFSYNSVSTSVPQPTNVNPSSSTHELALDLEPTFVFTPFDHFGFTGSLVADVPLTGSHDTNFPNGTTVSVDHSEFHIGAHIGLLGYF